MASAISRPETPSAPRARITAASITSPVEHRRRLLEHGHCPVGCDVLDPHRPSRSTVTDVSVERKSPSLIVETCERESGDQAPIECGWLRAYALTEAGARRSELPSRSTGLTALPLTLS